MAQNYPDGADMPYRVVYKMKGRSTQEVRFSEPAPAHREVLKLVSRGCVVDFDVWHPTAARYVTRDRYS